MRRFVVCLLLCFSVLLTGCSVFMSMSERALAYTSEKYGCEFTPMFHDNGDILSSNRSIECIAPGVDPENERVIIMLMKGDSGGTVFRDNYVAYLVRDELEESLREMISPEFSDFKLFTSIPSGVLPDELGAGTTLEQLYAVYPRYMVTVRVFVPASSSTFGTGTASSLSAEDFAACAQRIEDRFVASGHQYSVDLFVVNDSLYSEISRYDFDEFWHYYATHRKPEGDVYFHAYEVSIYPDGLFARVCDSYSG